MPSRRTRPRLRATCKIGKIGRVHLLAALFDWKESVDDLRVYALPFLTIGWRELRGAYLRHSAIQCNMCVAA
ncbi:hypothetical protein FRAAL4986 [Frankia alni ACN14a]|uniref:Uncharacterized protein n=1 Tax=Frankia alni (strain DSM 45986 / CECT 9034 / ACN14a) TaxID=326424 RepID=Q0RFW3_FRAAA|nr:hypothetical protein FRAAL4986 [Frankia alni ACN14a]